MSEISGAAATAGLILNPAATAWGTAGSLSTGDRCVAAFQGNKTVNKLIASAIGSGDVMSSDTQAGSIEYGFSLNGEATFQSGLDRVLGQFFGTAGAPTEQTVSQGDYLHRFTVNSSWNTNYCTYALESSTTTVLEFPSVAFKDLTLSINSPKSFLNWSTNAVCNTMVTSSPTNNNAAVIATTIADSEKAVVAASATNHYFYINTQSGGALTSGDLLPVTDYQLTLNKPQETSKEIGVTGNGAPVASDLMTGTLTITLRKITDNTWFTAEEAGSSYKALLYTEGTQIGTGVNKSYGIYIPKMSLIDPTNYGNTSAGINPLTISFDVLAAPSNPTGMNSTLPYVELINERTTAYIS